MVGSEAGPNVVPDDGNLTGCVLLDAPHTEWQISHNVIKEVCLTNGVVSEEQLSLSLILHVSEMRVAAKIKALFTTKASECHVSLDLVRLSHTEGALGSNLAVVLDCHNHVEQTVLLNEAAVGNALGRVLRRSVLKFVAVLSFLVGSVLPIVDCGFIFNFDVDVVAVTGEGLNKLVVLLPVLLVHIAELAEDEVTRAGEEESLRREFVLLGVRYSHGDIVVGAESTHPAPEHQFFEVSVSGLIQEGL